MREKREKLNYEDERDETMLCGGVEKGAEEENGKERRSESIKMILEKRRCSVGEWRGELRKRKGDRGVRSKNTRKII